MASPCSASRQLIMFTSGLPMVVILSKHLIPELSYAVLCGRFLIEFSQVMIGEVCG